MCTKPGCKRKIQKQGLYLTLFLSAEWESYSGKYDAAKHVKIELLEESNELQDLQERLKGGSTNLEFGFINRTLRNGSHYYPVPTYRSGKAWIKIARSVPAFKNAMFRNQITLKYLVVIHPKFWEDKFGQQYLEQIHT
jgi:hypothetical protein